MPMGLGADGMPLGLQIAGQLWSDATVLALAHAFQMATEHHLQRPDI